MRSRAWLGAVVAVAAAVWMSPMQEQVSAQSGARVVISEYRLRGPNGTNDEFIQLFNPSVADVDVSNWRLQSSTGNGVVTAVTTLPVGTRIRRGCFYLIANTTSPGSSAGTPDRSYANANGTPDNGGLALLTNTGITADQVGNGPTAAFGEGNRLPAFLTTQTNHSYERLTSTVAGFVDTNDNLADFQLISPATPHNSNPANCLTAGLLTVNGAAAPTNVEQGHRVMLTATVTPATLPGSTNVQVTGNLSAIGGSTTAQFADNGIAPDAVANDNIFSFEHLVPQINPLGARSITLNATDAEGRRGLQTFSVNVTLPATLYTPHQVQGAGATTPLALGSPIMVRGVVTAKKANGFFLQTETGVEDADPNTSEGLFVPANASQLTRALVGHLQYVKGVVAEIVPQSDPASPSITAVGDLSIIFDIEDRALPPAVELVELTSDEVSDSGTLDQLERFEGMRVHASLVAVSGTGLDGAFYAVVNGQDRPFREPGVESGYPVLECAVGPCNVPVFDGNPERLRVDSDGQAGIAAVDVSTGAAMDVTGPLDFESRTFTIVPDVQVTFAGGMSVLAVPAAAADRFTVASFFLGGAVNPSRLAKATTAIRDGLHMPDIIGVQEVENLAALTALAEAINDAVAAGEAAPNYAPLFIEDSDAAVGVLVKQAGGRVAVDAFNFAGANAVMLRATVSGPSTMLPQAITVIVPQLLSRDGSETGDPDGALVREQRKAQAEALANFVQSRHGEAIVVIGDFNAFSFNDGYVDVVGTVVGHPATGDQVATQTTSSVSPALVNLGELMPEAERYSSVSNGNAQALDHALATANLSSQFAGAARARINADFPAMLSGDPASPSRLSDRDPMVVSFRFPADTLAPVLSGVPADWVVEATSADGATVSFTPTAVDNLDGAVAVTCAPAGGSVFPLGHTGVTCSAQDVAGNVASAAFTVTVADTTAPSLTTPGEVTAEAASSAGAMVSFTVSAFDAVTAAPAIVCSRESGSLFALGNTSVSCSVHDAAGNSATAAFTVSVVDTTAPSLTMPGDVTAEALFSAGAPVSFSVTATDAVTASPAIVCSRASGSVFPRGTTTVGCSATDGAGNASPTGTFVVTVRDTIAPALGMPADVTAEAVSSTGAPVTFTVTASDAVTPSPSIVCSPASGSVFQVNTTTVQCSAQDAAGNTSNASFTVTVQDTVAPTLTVPANISEVATSSAGRVISFTTTATDAVTPSPTVNCTPASGSTFIVGDTVVTCAAADAAGNVATGTFTVTVTTPTPPPPATLPGRLAGAGNIVNGDDSVHFAFDVRESAAGERGYLLAQLRRPRSRPTFLIATHVSEVQMSNSPDYGPGTNPASGVDTLMFAGTGYYNGASGYRFVVNATDRGEPGRGLDTYSITVFAPNGQVVLSYSGVLRDGNIQSLR